MLLQHAWLATLIKPDTITEEDEEEAEAGGNAETGQDTTADSTVSKADSSIVDQEVADWVKDAIDKRKRGVLGKSPKPALHAAPLDAVSSPSKTGVLGLDG